MQQKFGNKGKKGDDDHDSETLGTIPKDAHLLGRKDEEPWRQKTHTRFDQNFQGNSRLPVGRRGIEKNLAASSSAFYY